ncbi:MAG: exodeoxyribonuclease VII large subunit [Lachnospiraceae bacterium]
MAGRPSIYSVGQVNRYIGNLFNQDFLLRKISVRGEISNCKYHNSGHIYLTLKDEAGVLNAVMFRSARSGLKFRLENGMKVVASGSISVYEKGGSYQLYIQSVEADGTGALYLQYEKLKKELEEMGMFAQEYKKPIPAYALRIGIVTAPSGAAIQDICNITARRNPCAQLYLYPALVQGEMASRSIEAGIRTLDRMGLDVIIVGRGGGSLEDLWAFNEERTARAIFDAETPIISAVGHETDYTISDFTADMRAPTPSAAAELAVFRYDTFLDMLQIRLDQLQGAMDGHLDMAAAQIRSLSHRLSLLSPRYQLQQKHLQIMRGQDRLQQAMEGKLKDLRHRLALSAGRLESSSPLKRLSGGFAYISDSRGQAVQTAAELKEGEIIKLTFSDGSAQARILDTDIPPGSQDRDLIMKGRPDA